MSDKVSKSYPDKNETIVAQSVLKKNWLISHELAEEGQVAVFDERSSELVLFNELGALVWEKLDGEQSVESIVESLLELPIEVPERSTVFEQVQSFLKQLLEKGAVRHL